MKYSTRKKLFGFCLVLPWIIGFVVFLLYPLSQTILYSFSNVTITPQGTETAPVGFKNYTDVLFTDPDFTLGIPTFLRQMVFMVPMIVVFSLLFALLLNSHIRGQRIYRAIFFLPVILISGPVLERIRQVGATNLPGVDSFFVFQFIYNQVPPVLSSPIQYIISNIVLIFWFSGVQVLIFLSGLQKVDNSLYEASMVDGASAWQRFWKITIPLIRPILVYVMITSMIGGLQMFDVPQILTNGKGGPDRTSTTMIMYLNNHLFSKNYGMAGAVSVVLFLVCAVLCVVVYFSLTKEDDGLTKAQHNELKAAKKVAAKAAKGGK